MFDLTNTVKWKTGSICKLLNMYLFYTSYITNTMQFHSVQCNCTENHFPKNNSMSSIFEIMKNAWESALI